MSLTTIKHLSRTALSRSFHTTAVARMGGRTPPLAPFARIPPPTEPMVENSDALFDDGVAPELALDFDAPNVSTREAAMSLAGAFGFLFILSQLVRLVTRGNPALIAKADLVLPDYFADHPAYRTEEEEN